MIFDPPLEAGVLLRRYRRFFADVRCADGSELTLHCANTGSMLNCLVPGSACWFSRSDAPGRKLPGTLEIVTTGDGRRAGVNTARANALVAARLAEALRERAGPGVFRGASLRAPAHGSRTP